MRSFRGLKIGVCAFALVGLGFVPVTHAEEAAKPATAISDEVKVSDAAKPIVDKMREAYAKVPGLQMAGTYTLDYDFDNDQQKQTADFTSSYKAPNKFRHEVKDDLLFGSTGEQFFSLTKNQYRIIEAPKSRGAVAELPEKFRDILQEKNPSLLIAMTDQPIPHLADGAMTIEKADDVAIDGKPFTALKVATKFDATAAILIDPATGLMRRLTLDAKGSLEKAGRQNVKKALLIIDYTTVKPEAPADKGAFVWSPPDGARDITADSEEKGDPAFALIGKPATDFELEGMDGKKVKLQDLKGQVVILDFWATWCGPCVTGLPILDKVADARKEKGLKVYAVNLEESKKEVAEFVRKSKLGLPVLLDLTGEIGRAYLANAIPQTVIIDKTGVVKKVLVGVHEQADLEKEIDAVLAN